LNELYLFQYQNKDLKQKYKKIDTIKKYKEFLYEYVQYRLLKSNNLILGLDKFNVQIKTEFKEMIHKNLKVTKSFMGIPYKKDDIMKQEVIFFTVNDEIKSYRLKKYNFKDLLITIDFVIEFDVKKYIFEYRGIM